jgi:hypothetical protein
LFVGFYGTSCVMNGKRQQKDIEERKNNLLALKENEKL